MHRTIMRDAGDSLNYGISALDAGLQVLQAIGQHPDQKVPQLATLTGLTKSKVFRIVRTLQAQGYVEVHDDHTVQLGAAALILGRQAEHQFTLVKAAGSTLDHLLTETAENVYLMIREGKQATVVDVRLSPYAVRTFAPVGTTAPLHAGAGAKVLLAYAPQTVIDEVIKEPLHAYTSGTVTRPEALRELLSTIRQDGIHEAVSDLEEQVVALAVPVLDHQHQVIAAISVAGPLPRMQAARDNVSHLLLEGSRQVSARLGA